MRARPTEPPALKDQVLAGFGGHLPDNLAVAVSGGGDSMALLHLVHRLCTDSVQVVQAVSVDHGLRPESGAEMELVARTCTDLGIKHTTLHWKDWDGQGNLQDAARRARYGLMADWAAENGVTGLALGHTADDQAETVLLRLARKAGVDGLSAMDAKSTAYGVTLYRPLLGVRRSALRDYLIDHGLHWADDPSNDQLKYDRIKMRQALDVLKPLGVNVEGLTDLASYMGQTRDALNWQTAETARGMCIASGGELHIDTSGFQSLPFEIKRRLLVKSLGFIGQNAYAPRREAVDRVLQAIEGKEKTTLAGCVIRPKADRVVIYRELKALEALTADTQGNWDNRWQISGDLTSGAHIAALGEDGAQSIANWRDQRLTLEQVAVHPGIWAEDTLICAPTLQNGTDYVAKPLQSTEDFISSLYSH